MPPPVVPQEGLQGISSHGTVIEMMPVGETEWMEIAELGDLQMPGFTRNEFDITPHSKNIDQYVVGVLRRDPVTFPMFFNKQITSHYVLQQAQLNSDSNTNMKNGFRVSSPDGGILIFSGAVKEMKQTNPVDGVQTANVVIRATGNFILDGEEYGD